MKIESIEGIKIEYLQHVTSAHMKPETAKEKKRKHFLDSANFWQHLFRDFNLEQAEILTHFTKSKPTIFVTTT